MNESYSAEQINWAEQFLYRHPGPSDPRDFEILKEEWIRATRIKKWAEEQDERD